MSDITDLDVFVGQPRKAKLGGKIYLLPRDIPAELYLEILDLQDRPDDLDDAQVVRKLAGDVLELFQVHQPEMERLPAAVSIPVLVQLIGRVYSGAAEPERPTRPRASGSRGTAKSKPKPRSRSSR